MRRPYRRHLSPRLLAALLCAASLFATGHAACQQPAPPPAAPLPAAPPAITEPARQQPTAPTEAQPLPPDIAERITKLTTAIETAEKAIQFGAEREQELSRLRIDVEGILADASNVTQLVRPQLDAVRPQIERLGPPPGKDGPAEAPAIASERARLTAQSQALDGAIKSTELTWVRARQLIEKITALRHAMFAKNLMQRLPSPLLPGLWRDLAQEAPAIVQRFGYWTQDWWRQARAQSGSVSLIIGAALVLLVVLWLASRKFTDRRRFEAPTPYRSFFERVVSVAWVAPLRALPAIAAAGLSYGGFDALDLLYPPWRPIATTLLECIAAFAASAALISAILAPREPAWRLLPLADAPARRTAWLLVGIAALFALDAASAAISAAFYVPLMWSVAQSVVVSILFAGLLIALLLTPFAPPDAEAPPVSRAYPPWLKLPLLMLAIAIVATALLGFVALSRFIAEQLVLTTIVIFAGLFGYLIIRALTREQARRSDAMGEVLETRFGLDEGRRQQLARLTELVLTLGLIVCAIPVFMLQWGYAAADIRDRFRSLLFGMEIGPFRVSLARILLGVVLFIALLFATRVFQRWLREKALRQTRMDAGIVNSIDTFVGYLCIAVSGVIALAYAGFDITNLAIVAGALSVGIGFGLQSIVNNFVSGLILLIERPIKVGDRIVIGDQQGHVRRISVRATEIETFDRASLIVPNSELITGRVLNWTHRDSLGSVNVKVGVGYDADPAQVMQILRQAADDHPDVLRTPAPSAAFDDFGASALQFSLRICLADVGKAQAVQSDLRIAIFKALRAANIDIPFNQLDVSLRDLETIKRYVTEVLDQRPNGVAGEQRGAAKGS